MNAIPAVLAFEAYCSVAGTYAVALRSSNSDRSIVFPITIAAGEVSTWKKFTFAVPATTSGTFARDNTLGLMLWFTVMVGSTFAAPAPSVWSSGSYIGLAGQSNLLSTINQSFSVRAIGLYPDPGGTGLAPPFQMPDYATEMLKCQRYWQQVNSFQSFTPTSGSGYYTSVMPVVSPRVLSNFTGISSSGSNFPNTTGTLTVVGNTIRELRNANATAGNGAYGSTITINARM